MEQTVIEVQKLKVLMLTDNYCATSDNLLPHTVMSHYTCVREQISGTSWCTYFYYFVVFSFFPKISRVACLHMGIGISPAWLSVLCPEAFQWHIFNQQPRRFVFSRSFSIFKDKQRGAQICLCLECQGKVTEIQLIQQKETLEFSFRSKVVSWNWHQRIRLHRNCPYSLCFILQSTRQPKLTDKDKPGAVIQRQTFHS